MDSKVEENYKRLVELVENDIKERQDQVQQDLLNMRKELFNIKDSIKEEESEITLSTSDGTIYKVNKQDYDWYIAHTPNGYSLYRNGEVINTDSYSVCVK